MVLRGYRAWGYRAKFGIFEKIESGAIKPTYEISKILFSRLKKMSNLALCFSS